MSDMSFGVATKRYHIRGISTIFGLESILFPRFRLPFHLFIWWSIREPYLRVTLSVICFDWFLVRGISLPVTQLFVIAIENILRWGVINLTSS